MKLESIIWSDIDSLSEDHKGAHFCEFLSLDNYEEVVLHVPTDPKGNIYFPYAMTYRNRFVEKLIPKPTRKVKVSDGYDDHTVAGARVAVLDCESTVPTQLWPDPEADLGPFHGEVISSSQMMKEQLASLAYLDDQ
ncbi:hypothetical protein STEG23_034342, partial [Scotinomys teguina]